MLERVAAARLVRLQRKMRSEEREGFMVAGATTDGEDGGIRDNDGGWWRDGDNGGVTGTATRLGERRGSVCVWIAPFPPCVGGLRGQAQPLTGAPKCPPQLNISSGRHDKGLSGLYITNGRYYLVRVTYIIFVIFKSYFFCSF